MSLICLAAAGILVRIAAASFTLSWTHTVEQVEWSETWRVAGDGLRVTEASVAGSGAGMEPPPEARLVAGRYVWSPEGPSVPHLLLRRAAEAGDWRLCVGGRCAPLGIWVGADADPVRVFPCPAAASPR